MPSQTEEGRAPSDYAFIARGVLVFLALNVLIFLFYWGGETPPGVEVRTKRSNRLRPQCFHLHGYSGDPEFTLAKCWAEDVPRLGHPDLIKGYSVDVKRHTDKYQYLQSLRHEVKPLLYPQGQNHISGPFIYEGCEGERLSYIGTVHRFTEILMESYGIEERGRCHYGAVGQY